MKKNQQMLRRIQAINDTKIQYLSVVNKIYQVKSIDSRNMKIEATQTDLTIADVPENELWDISYFEDYRIRLINGGSRMGEIVDFGEWVERNRGNSCALL